MVHLLQCVSYTVIPIMTVLCQSFTQVCNTVHFSMLRERGKVEGLLRGKKVVSAQEKQIRETVGTGKVAARRLAMTLGARTDPSPESLELGISWV